MGLLRELLLLPAAPLRGVVWTMRRVVDEGHRVQRDNIRRELIALENELRKGRITDDEFDRKEDDLLDQLEQLDREQSNTEP